MGESSRLLSNETHPPVPILQFYMICNDADVDSVRAYHLGLIKNAIYKRPSIPSTSLSRKDAKPFEIADLRAGRFERHTTA